MRSGTKSSQKTRPKRNEEIVDLESTIFTPTVGFLSQMDIKEKSLTALKHFAK